MKETTDNFLLVSERAVRETGELIKKIQADSLLETSVKKDGTYVTKADKEGENNLVKIISSEFPEHRFHGEEFGDRNTESSSPYQWAIDPIDGTSAYKNHEFTACINMSLLKDDKPILGIVYNPFTRELFTAAEKRKSKLNDNEIPIIKQEKIDTLSFKLPKQGVKDLDTLATLQLDGSVDRIISQRGSPAYAFALVAKGSHSGFVMDCYKEPSPEDYSAGVLLVRNAGGLVTNLKGKDINPINHKGYLVAGANPKIHKKILETLNDYGFGKKRTSGKIVYLGGFYGTGKSTLAMKLEKGLGYQRFNSDITRRELSKTGYDLKDADVVWGLIFWKAGQAMKDGKGVIMESTYLNEEQRAPDYDLGRSKNAEGMFIEFICPEDVAKKRIKSRPVSPDGVHVPTNRAEDYDKIKDKWEPIVPGLKNAERSFVSYMIYDSHKNTLHEGFMRNSHRNHANKIADCLGLPIHPKNDDLLNKTNRY